MNGVFTYSDNKIALERNSPAEQERSFSRRLITGGSLIFKTDGFPSYDVKIYLTRRGITQSVSVISERFLKRKCHIMLTVLHLLMPYFNTCWTLGTAFLPSNYSTD